MKEGEDSMPRSDRGFASMDRSKQREIAAKSGEVRAKDQDVKNGSWAEKGHRHAGENDDLFFYAMG